ncbi:MAG: FKBP-type peptidyl-prolyl cis-trans isomerase [Rhodocyclaceae bacterium]|jgi:FKBP-type peptidyl-prolyl cis-trans isomerase SlpA|nr:FKBP-type peptidyl-prolyl cis-trans isomerase [Rhodocyclaceae bacterium]
MSERVKPDSLVTLHYRLATADDVELVSTFDASPATLQLGSGELAPPLEACLAGLPVGERHVFLLEPEQAFGPHNPQLRQRMPRAELPGGGKIELHALVEFGAPNGGKFAGVVREMDAESALVDFNHPLAGKSIRFEVEVIGIL